MLEEYSDNILKIDVFPAGKLFRISFDASVRKMRILCKRHELLDEVQNAFSSPNKKAFFVSRFGYKTESKVYVVNKFGYFSSGLLFEILQWIQQQYGSLESVVMSTACRKYVLDYLTPLKADFQKYFNGKPFEVSNMSEDLGRNNELRRKGKQPFEYRDYQQKAVELLLSKGYGRGLIEIPTAGGKSFIIANYIWNIHKQFDSSYRCLILVPNKQLVMQFYNDLIDYGFDKHKVTRFTAGLNQKRINERFDKDALIIVANRQYVFKNKGLLPKIDVLICDEAHQCLASASMDLIESLNCKLKIGCSGTLPRDKHDRWQLIGLFSRILYVEDITALQRRGFISQLKITLLKITDSAIQNDRSCLFHIDSTRKYHADENGISEVAFDEAYHAEHDWFAKHYRDLYAPVFSYLLSLNSNTLLLFDRIEIGKNLFEYAKELYTGKKNVYYIDGSIDVKVREQIRASFEEDDGNLLIAQSATFATGINIKRLTNLVFLTSSKSFSRTIQSIGRTLRLHESKTAAHLIDVSWSYKYSTKHLNERLAIYKKMYNKTPDEVVNITI